MCTCRPRLPAVQGAAQQDSKPTPDKADRSQGVGEGAPFVSPSAEPSSAMDIDTQQQQQQQQQQARAGGDDEEPSKKRARLGGR